MISVVIAVRDQAQFLGEAIDSVFAQTRPVHELIVVDDASVDSTADVARSRGIEPLAGPGRGPAIARNIGAAQATGEFLCFLDGDDRFTPGRNEALIESIGVAAACSGMVSEFFDPGREDELAARFKISNGPQAGGTPCSMAIRREVFEEIGGFPSDEKTHDFFDFVRRLGAIPRVDEVVLERRIHGANRTIVDRDLVHSQYLSAVRAAVLAKRQGGGI